MKIPERYLRQLEMRIPPPVIALACAILMWFSTPEHSTRSWDGLFLILLGMSISSSALWLFLKAETNFHPHHFDASCLVTDGPYQWSRNPMYLGLLFVLVGWALILGSVVSLIGPLLCQQYLTRFQILPEENYLIQRFGITYEQHLQTIPRWI